MVGRHLGALRDEPIDRIGLVLRARHQGVEHVLEPLGGVALQDEVVEAVERDLAPGADHGKAPALGGIGIDVVEVLEVGRILQLAECREPVARLRKGGGSRAESCDKRQHPAEPRRRCRTICLGRRRHLPRAVASAFCFSGSIHQTCVKAAVILRQRVGAAENIPGHEALERIVPVRHDVVVPQQHAVEGMRRRDEIGAILGEHDLVDQLVDRRVLDAGRIARAVPVGGGRAPEVALLVAGRVRLREAVDDDVVVVAVFTALVLAAVDPAHACLDAELFQVLHIGQHYFLEVGVVEQELRCQRLAFGVASHVLLAR